MPCAPTFVPTALATGRKMLSTMNLQRRFGYLLFLLPCTMPGRAQSGAQLTLSQATVTAGDTVNIDLNNLEFPASCDTSVQVFFGPQSGSGGFVLSGLSGVN
jgi:hypothetical protein